MTKVMKILIYKRLSENDGLFISIRYNAKGSVKQMNYKESIIKYEPVNEQEANDKKIILDYINHFHENILTRQNEIAHITSSGLILNKSLDKMLMIYHNIYNTWTWTGGHADGDSDMLKVALKEAKEETGISNIVPLTDDLASIDIIPVYGHIKRGRYVSAHLNLNVSYVLIADEEEKPVVNEEETSGVGWVEVDRLTEYSNEPYLIAIYNKILNNAKSVRF
jgi:8-oxo-dGTP pyrophosphatase MutT (NUDIX family)